MKIERYIYDSNRNFSDGSAPALDRADFQVNSNANSFISTSDSSANFAQAEIGRLLSVVGVKDVEIFLCPESKVLTQCQGIC